MDEEVGYVIRLALEVMICSMVIWACLFFGRMSKQVYINRQNDEVIQDTITSRCELFYFDSKIVSSSDVVEMILTYPGQYKITLVQNGTSKVLDPNSTSAKNNYKNYYSQNNIMQFVGLNSNQQTEYYYSTLVRDNYSKAITEVRLVKRT